MNNSINLILDEIKKDALSNEDLKDLLDEQIQITKYSDINKLSHADQLFDRLGRGIVLFNWSPNEGHWIGLIKRGNIIEFYDPYGNTIEKLPNDLRIPPQIQNLSGMSNNLLKKFIEESGYTLYQKPEKHQQQVRDINTCGRHVGLRLLLHNMSLPQYNDLMNKIKREGIDLDEFVGVLTEVMSGDISLDQLNSFSGSGTHTPHMSKNQLEQLHKLYYDDKNLFGRDKLFKLANEKGINVSRRQVADWLTKQEVWQTNVYPTRNNPKTIKSTVSKGPNKQIGIDLIDMQNYKYDGYEYILTGIDMFSKKGYAEALKSKNEKDVKSGMIKMLNKIGSVGSIRSDNGSEFISKSFKAILKGRNIKQVLSLPGKPQSNGQVERFNQTLKRMLLLALKIDSSYDWVSILDEIVSNYNNSWQSTIKTTPNHAADATTKGKNEIYQNILNKSNSQLDGPKFKVGDRVRVKLDKKGKDGAFWSKKIYTIEKVIKPKSTLSNPSYKLNGVSGKQSMFYNNDLQLINVVENIQDDPNNMFEVSKLIRPSFQNGVPGYIVRWKWYDVADDTWEPKSQLEIDVPKLVKAFDKKHNVEWFSDTFHWNSK